jgi:hypothetical protein
MDSAGQTGDNTQGVDYMDHSRRVLAKSLGRNILFFPSNASDANNHDYPFPRSAMELCTARGWYPHLPH